MLLHNRFRCSKLHGYGLHSIGNRRVRYKTNNEKNDRRP